MSAGKVSSVAIVLALSVALAFEGTASAADGTNHRANTKVSINSWPDGLFGTVESPQNSCAQKRGVMVYEERGTARHSQTDRLIGTTSARKRKRSFTHGRTAVFQWSLRKKIQDGSFYARARKAEGCRPDLSRTYSVLPQGSIPACPSLQQVCSFEQLHFDGNCESFTKGQGGCYGDSTTGRYPWNASSARFTWASTTPPERRVYYSAYANNATTGTIRGTVPGPGAAAYSIAGACADATNPRALWVTPDLPGAAPGDQGGPLHLDYQAHDIGTDDVYIRGYLYYRGQRGSDFCG